MARWIHTIKLVLESAHQTVFNDIVYLIMINIDKDTIISI